MITRYHKLALTASLVLAMVLTFSCSSDDDGDGNEPSYNYCITADNTCLTGPFTASTCTGQPSNSCPYSNSSSSVTGGGSSSSSVGNLCAGFDPNAEIEHYGKNKKQICDSRDGKKYVYVTIGEQVWMAENLNYNASRSRCRDSDPNCTLGRLYDWATAMSIDAAKYNGCEVWGGSDVKHRGICPAGWHLPSNAEWDVLVNYVDAHGGSSNTVRDNLKATSGWCTEMYLCSHNNGTDDYGFATLPEASNELYAFWWTSSDVTDGTGDCKAYFRKLQAYDLYVSMDKKSKSSYYSVRCVKG